MSGPSPAPSTSDFLLGYYGDDFTGSTDAMEALTLAGVPTALFLEPPGGEALRRFRGIRAVGVAGITRSLRTEAIPGELEPALRALQALGPSVVHYKVCSTFDSSPSVGSIGRAIEVGQAVFSSPFVPVVVGVPALARYVAFGNLFARSGLESEVFRLDRHPTMSRHPVTPMDESDLRRHLGRQTAKRIGLFDAVELERLSPEGRERRLEELEAAGSEVVLFDTLYDRHLEAIGELLWSRASRGGILFAVGSSGVEYALAAHWRKLGIAQPRPSWPVPKPERVVVVSGSCSPVTDEQIRYAVEHGFVELPVETEALLSSESVEPERRRLVSEALRALELGRSVILHTCRGPDDPRKRATAGRLAGRTSAELLGSALGDILREVIERSGVRRAGVAGGDTSSYVARRLGIAAMEMTAPLAPGAPLCRAHAPGSPVDGLELAFKGGQVGKRDFFVALRG